MNVEECLLRAVGICPKGEPFHFMLQDCFGEYPLMPEFYAAKTVKFKVSEGEIKYGEFVPGALTKVYEFEYVDNLLRKIKYYGKNGTLNKVGKFEYDNEGRIKRESIYNGSNLAYEYTYKYKSDMMFCYYNDSEVGRVCLYDDEDRCIESRSFNNGVEKLESEVEYDNNKISRVISIQEWTSDVLGLKYDSRDRLTEITSPGYKFYYEGDKLSSVEYKDDVAEYFYDNSNLPAYVMIIDEEHDDFKRIDIIVNFE